jgi:hypothetical protein
MSATIELNPEIAEQILTNAESKGLSVEIYLKKIIETRDEDKRVSAMREAVKDELFLADLTETMTDFHHSDFE